jgi:hypothetical protein
MRRHIANAAGGFYVTARSFTPDAEQYAATLPMITLVDGELSTVNETKTSVRDARRERFDFLVMRSDHITFGRMADWYLDASPSTNNWIIPKTSTHLLKIPAVTYFFA